MLLTAKHDFKGNFTIEGPLTTIGLLCIGRASYTSNLWAPVLTLIFKVLVYVEVGLTRQSVRPGSFYLLLSQFKPSNGTGICIAGFEVQLF